MNRYIDANLIRYKDLPFSANDKVGVYVGYCSKSQIDAIPTADVQEVKHGYWEVVGRDLTLNNVEGKLPLSYQLRQCSECEYVTVAARTETHKWCPHCGAKMDGGEE